MTCDGLSIVLIIEATLVSAVVAAGMTELLWYVYSKKGDDEQ